MNPSFTFENKAWSTAKKKVAGFIRVLLASSAVMRHTVPNPSALVRLSSGPSSVVPAAAPNAEAADFASLKTGMSYKQVVAILGSKGEETVSTEMAGVKTVLYEWKDEKVWANKNAVFQNDSLISKKQFDLK